MDELRECPWCGEKPAGLSICEGSTFRWVIGSCPSCGANPGEIRRDTSISAEDRHIEDEKIAIAAWNARAPAVPEGWQLVPVVPTQEMMKAADDALMFTYRASDWDEAKDVIEGISLKEIYDKFIAAAPKVTP